MYKYITNKSYNIICWYDRAINIPAIPQNLSQAHKGSEACSLIESLKIYNNGNCIAF